MKNEIIQPLEGLNYGNMSKKTQLRKGLKIKINRKTFEIVGYTNKKIPLKYFASLTTTMENIQSKLKQEGRLTNLFGEKL